jgi:DNA-directed RNA polymerase subunit RPC12/RpoP
MATTIVIACPKCHKQLKGPAEVQGKTIRCKACGHTFAVQPAKTAADSKSGAPKTAPPTKPTPKTAPAKTPTPAKPSANAVKKPAPPKKAEPEAANPVQRPEDSTDTNRPYQFIEEHRGVYRCPQCAFEMESEDAVVCLQCGYNTQTRTRLATVKTYDLTSADYALWLTPGILCVVVVVVCLGVIGFLWFGLPHWAPDAWYNHFSVQVWGSVVFGFIGWYSGKFAFRRLIVHSTPPEKIKAK